VLEALRHAHADYFFAIQYKLSRQEWMAKNQLVYTMQAARWRRVLGRADPMMTPYESGLAAALAPEHVPEPEQLKAEILSIYAKFNLFDGTVHQRAALHLHLDGLLAKLATKAMPTQMIKTDRVTVEHSSSVDAVGGGLAVDKRKAHITLKQEAAQDRAYIESCFGRSLYPPERLRKAEQELCTGEHLGCHLWFASGVPSPEQAPTPEAKHLAEQAQLQAERNRAYYSKNLELHRSVVLRLTEQIRNCILVHQQPNARVARSGNLDPERVWRTVMDDDRVFRCAEEENHPSFTVDLLLDASASRLHCQEVIAAQGSILAQSLTACGIPAILAGILTQLALYSINLRIMGTGTGGGKANLPISVDKYSLLVSARYVRALALNNPIFVLLIFCAVLIGVLYWFFGTELGCSLRATGANQHMARAQGINTNVTIVLGLMVSNGLVALAGGLLSQYQGFSDINMGRGAIVIGLAAVIIGEVIFGKIFRNFALKLTAAVIGAIIYYIVMNFVLRMGLSTDDLKLLTALVVAVFLTIPYWKGKYFTKVPVKKGGKDNA